MRRRDEHGFALIEIMIAVTIMALVVWGTLGFFNGQQRIAITQQALAETKNNGLRAVDVLSRHLRMIGLGVNRSLAITAGDSTSLTFLADLNNAATYLTADHALNATTLTVDSTAGFSAANSVGITDETGWTYATVATVSSSTAMTITPGLASVFSRGSRVYAYTTTAFAFESANKQITRNGAILTTDIDDLTFRYYDVTNTVLTAPLTGSALQSVTRIDLTVVARTAKPVPPTMQYKLVSFSATIKPRNLT